MLGRVLVLLLLLLLGPAPALIQGVDVRVEALVNGTALLPCETTPPSANESVTLVIWFRNEMTPVYSYDARGKFSQSTAHWKERRMEERAHFRIEEINRATLSLRHVRESDEGLYRCRVDFKQSPSKNTRVHLIVVVPPQKPLIMEAGGSEIESVAGPYEEGFTLRLICVVSGGRPTPTVRWWRGDNLLEVRHPTPGDDQGVVRSQLKVEQLSREDLGAQLTCKASNSRLVAPVTSSVHLDMYLKPLWASIVTEQLPLSAGRQHDMECRSVGSRPPARISWWLDNAELDGVDHKVSPDNNVTTSTLHFTPTSADHDKVITCRAENKHVRGGVEEDSWRLDVYFKPLVQLHLGPSLNANDIEEGDDVYFECKIKSNPHAYKVTWRNNGQQLVHSQRNGVIMSNHHLALQAVSRHQAGNYSCVASNVEGDSRSNTVMLKVQYKPVCRVEQAVIVAVAQGEKTRLYCHVDSLPEPSSFHWTVGNTSLPMEDVTKTSGDWLDFVPAAPSDYGLVVCWASNSVGIQAAPCVYHVIPAGKPDPPSNCSLVNQTSRSLQLDCVEGFDGGQAQQFELLVFDALTGTQLSNMTSLWPSFSVVGLSAGQMLRLVVYATNSRGRSPSVVVEAFTLKAAEKHTAGLPVPFELTPILSVLLSVATVLLLAVVAIISSQRIRSKQRPASTVLGKITPPEVEDTNPDVIPCKKGTNDPQLSKQEPAFASESATPSWICTSQTSENAKEQSSLPVECCTINSASASIPISDAITISSGLVSGQQESCV